MESSLDSLSVSPEVREILNRIIKKSPEHCCIQIRKNTHFPDYGHPIISFDCMGGFIDLLKEWDDRTEEEKVKLKPFLLEIFMLKRVWKVPEPVERETGIATGVFIPLGVSSISLYFKD